MGQHAGREDEPPVRLEVVDYRATAQAGGAGTSLPNGEEGGGAEGSQAHDCGNFGNQQGETLVEHVG